MLIENPITMKLVLDMNIVRIEDRSLIWTDEKQQQTEIKMRKLIKAICNLFARRFSVFYNSIMHSSCRTVLL